MSATEGTIFKKCDMKAHRPESNRACRAGTCQHTCARPDRCSHAWTLRYLSDGKQRERSYSTKKLAEEAQLQMSHDKRAGERVFIDRNAASKEKFGAACIAYIDALRCSDSTRMSYRTVYYKWIGPDMGHMTLVQASRAHAVAEELVTVKMKDLSATRRRMARSLITCVLDKAVRQDKLTAHKITGIEIEDDTAPVHDEFLFPSFAQVEKLADAIGICVWLMRGCGLRISEALAVEKADFRNGGRTLRVSGQSSRDGRRKLALKHRKPGEYRDVPVPAWLWEKVENLPDGPLMPGNGGRPYPVYGTVNDQFVKHTPRAGIPAGFHAHSLRHMYASVMLVEGGIDITEVARFLGHRNINVTYAIYGHLLPDANERAIAALDAEFERWSKAGSKE